jgi:hypothetical protein
MLANVIHQYSPAHMKSMNCLARYICKLAYVLCLVDLDKLTILTKFSLQVYCLLEMNLLKSLRFVFEENDKKSLESIRHLNSRRSMYDCLPVEKMSI